ncbi:MAG TPA: isochorismatase family protein [Actinocrinis sp.]|jgi:nicotinamidase-related amidase
MTTVLLLIDVQNNMLLPPEPVPDAAAVGPAIRGVLGRARERGATVVHIRNAGGSGDPDEPGTSGWELVHEVRGGESVVDKDHPDAFQETDLADVIPPNAPLVLVGMQSEYCVRETALAALDRKHPVTLVRGAHATYPGDEPAEVTSRQIEEELAKAGVKIVDPADVEF